MPGCAPSSAASSFRPPAPPRSAAGCSRPSIRSITTRCGLRAPTSSRGSACRKPKIKSIKAIGTAIAKGQIDLDAVAAMEADQAHAALTALHGIGPWTADIYLLFCLGNADAWPAGDLALQEAARIAFGLRKRPDAKEMVKLAEAVAAVARGGRASAVGLLSRGEAARGRAGARQCESTWPAVTTRRKRKSERSRAWPVNSTARGSSRRSGQAKRLVVFLHGYGADGNDLIDIGRAWQGLLPDTAFVSPHAPEPCGQAPIGRQWFPLTFRTPNERWDRRQQGRRRCSSSSSTPSSRAASCRRRRWRWSASARAP